MSDTTPRLPSPRRILSRPSWPELRTVREALASETIGGALLIGAAVVALVWASSPAGDVYRALRDTVVGPAALHLDLSIGTWAADGLLAIFFFIAGMELKREFVCGDLRDPARAAVPVAAACAGVVVPAVLFVLGARLLGAEAEVLAGWAVPTATDIAFALAVLAVAAPHLPGALRAFLLTLAVVDDLIAITIIAVFFTESMHALLLLAAIVPLGVFWLLVRRAPAWWWLRLPAALLVWALVHASGVHATVAGVLLGLAVPVGTPLAHRLERRIHPISAGLAVPVFAFFAAGVDVLAGGGPVAILRDPAAIVVIAALVVGKLLGVFGGTWVTARFTRAELDPALGWVDVLGVALLAGIGFTVSLLISELAFGAGTPRDDHVKVGVLAASLLSALLATAVLRRRDAAHRALADEESRDDDGDGVPDVYARGGERG